ncbi:F0F1 ATP synthase subunit A [Brucella pituitosa]|uniref:ATP synthase subunit a n=1 Tax=Brucella pituitosa TaxID=571256 RepID=A0A643F8S6_9HYPH|nr:MULTISPECIES: F0F1 ATP synthase subunit A [Brucella]PQZ47081.1 F0F1 ATP synthase subunit A [Ochrobactrum sp. MYb19]PRA61673.1 F0F1 ATP synthase subunit A [Ochrobactrum sp. MYb18]PRA76489.1 F0F1 ATP synthase subunit A [Brucella thiophenivorans]PRA85786.1 F0F1 ATP synthase subunit A [Ochrobactrum sp. MYb14]PRA87055.1 F0F1 ATP synthase subunit A [Ochrobactrum sp. MYb29]PRA98494.1 F0F1 ATP synthase subunit A [Ochrobactrum sp. MYb15]TCQ82673.1 ATP synthase F0 subcomplex A subunit [Ochrobactrum
MAGPIEQFAIRPIVELGTVGGQQIVFTNSALYMLLTVTVAAGFLFMASRRSRVVPGRWQSSAEMLYEFVSKTIRENAGEHGMKFFPLVFSLFMFILVANLIGMFPYAFTVTSHIIVTFALAMLVFLTVTIYGLLRHGFKFFRLFMPAGVPVMLAPIIVPIELMSYISRPISHSVRLFAVMLAGHITLKVFAGFVVGLGSLGSLGLMSAIMPLAMTVALTALELLMAIIQAYVFTMLSCMYLNDALHPSH